MKKIFKGLGILLIVCGLIQIFVYTKGQESVKPGKAYVGYIDSDGKFSQTDSGYLGGNREGYEALEDFKGLGVMSCIAGGVLVVISLITKESE